MKDNLEIMTIGGGCFWCFNAIFNQVKGVKKTETGYMGGTVPGIPTYREVCSGLTGHAEVVQVTFNPNEISYKELLIIFLTSHDPTTLNRQGADVGTQYRSVIFYHDDSQKQIAKTVVDAVSPYFESPIVTQITAAEKFHAADNDHQDFFENNPNAGYCNVVISPKLAKLRHMHANKLK
ncbi:peptide-methionine (S)-S-oxide reductase MsrA [Lacinutrix undariae]